MNPRNVGVAAEALVAAQFARLGFDVSVQYGANQPEYDLVVVKDDQAVKISVKGSQDGAWGLAQTQLAKLRNANYHGAIDEWLGKHGMKTIFCFVQFQHCTSDQMPRMYLATPSEVASQLRASCGGRGDTMLREKHQWTSRSKTAAGQTEEIPASWKFSEAKVQSLFTK